MPDKNKFGYVETEKKEQGDRSKTGREAGSNYRIGMNSCFRASRDVEASQTNDRRTESDQDVFLPESPETPSFGPPSGVQVPSGPEENVPPDLDGNIPASPGEGPEALPTPSVPGGTVFPVFPGGIGNIQWPPFAIYPIPIIPGAGGSARPGYCVIRFLHAVTGQETVNITVGGRPVVNDLHYGEISSYFIETAGVKMIRVTDPVQRPILFQETFWFNEGDVYTIALVNGMDGITAVPVPDAPCRNTRMNFACVRAVNLSYNAPAIDVTLQPARIGFDDLRFKTISPYRQVVRGSQEFYASETISGAEIFRMEEEIEVGKMYTLYIIGDAYGEPEISGVFTEDYTSLEGYL